MKKTSWIRKTLNFLVCADISTNTRRSIQSIPEYSLLLKKPPTVNKKKILTTLNLGPQNRVGHNFQNCLDTWGHKWMVRLSGKKTRKKALKNGIKMEILGVVGFKSLNDYCLSSWFIHQKLNTHSALFFANSVICHDFRDSHIFHPFIGLK